MIRSTDIFTPKIVPIVTPTVPNNPSLSVILFIRSKTVFKTLTPELSVSESRMFVQYQSKYLIAY